MMILDIPWTKPVTVELQCGMRRLFRGAYDALDFLENEWPIRKGSHYRQAVRLCRVALSRTSYAEAAHDAFVAACSEAMLYCGHGRPVASMSHAATHASS
ncbi:DUF982 domain-containing protein [Rhizobium sp. KVB221]|uniref:DUF982 domain-containing protein n=1 Tax=Rhizobium setariae TaxID=2801340 RepID=A0A937CMW1_9HYPH|nr:DUF982 domain-containing protein [Rhizobium setariae]MBL0371364.1 DUF982 domain-containing protein [Rhizobium setariae]